jgi:hypothetical protein
MWETLHVQDVEEMADGRLSRVIRLASTITNPKESKLQREESVKMLYEELKPEEASLLIRIVSQPLDADATLEQKDAQPANSSPSHANNWLTGLGGNNFSFTKAPSSVRPASRHSLPSYLSNSLGWLSFPSLQQHACSVAQTPRNSNRQTPHEARAKATAEVRRAALHVAEGFGSYSNSVPMARGQSWALCAHGVLPSGTCAVSLRRRCRWLLPTSRKGGTRYATSKALSRRTSCFGCSRRRTTS